MFYTREFWERPTRTKVDFDLVRRVRVRVGVGVSKVSGISFYNA